MDRKTRISSFFSFQKSGQRTPLGGRIIEFKKKLITYLYLDPHYQLLPGKAVEAGGEDLGKDKLKYFGEIIV
jgi:hypothetical protein